jgi:hypothetical protein
MAFADVSYEADPLLDLPHGRKRVRWRGVRLTAEELNVETGRGVSTF